MYHCMKCKVEYEEESAAKDCCTHWVFGDDENDIRSPRKHGKYMGGTHVCPNVTLGDTSWSTFIKAEGKCPMCAFVDMGR